MKEKQTGWTTTTKMLSRRVIAKRDVCGTLPTPESQRQQWAHTERETHAPFDGLHVDGSGWFRVPKPRDGENEMTKICTRRIRTATAEIRFTHRFSAWCAAVDDDDDGSGGGSDDDELRRRERNGIFEWKELERRGDARKFKIYLLSTGTTDGMR